MIEHLFVLIIFNIMITIIKKTLKLETDHPLRKLLTDQIDFSIKKTQLLAVLFILR